MATSATREPNLPVLVWESGDLHVFGSVAEAESALEPIDVKGSIYEAYDASGRLLSLTVRVYTERLLGVVPVKRERVSVTLAEDEPSHRERLMTVATQFLAALGTPPERLLKMGLEELVAAVAHASRAVR